MKMGPIWGEIKQGAKPLWCSRKKTKSVFWGCWSQPRGWWSLKKQIQWVDWSWCVFGLVGLAFGWWILLQCLYFHVFLFQLSYLANLFLRKFEIWLNKLNWMCKFLLQHAFKTIFAVCKQVHCNWCTRNCPPVRGTDPLLEAQAELGTVGLLFSVGFGVVGRVVFADFRTQDFPKQKKVTTSKSYI